MCGRYLRRSDKQRIAEAFRLLQDLTEIPLPPDYNVAPSTFQPVIRLNRDTQERELILMRWGLIPHHAKSSADYKNLFTINARAETVTTNALWRRPFERHRCLVPADGFYEWKKDSTLPPSATTTSPSSRSGRGDALNRNTSSADPPLLEQKLQHPQPQLKQIRTPKRPARQPYVFTPELKLPFAFAGLWDAWRDPATGDWLQSFAIITTDANNTMAPIHNRMPVILEPRDYDRWLSRSPDHQPPTDLLRPPNDNLLVANLANPAVGNVRNNDPDLLRHPTATRQGIDDLPPLNSA